MNSNQSPFPNEPAGGQWHKYSLPVRGFIAQKTSSWTADSWTGGLEIDWTGVKREGMRAVMCSIVILETSASGSRFYAKAADEGNISDTPNFSNEASCLLGSAMGTGYALRKQVMLPVSKDCKTLIACHSTAGQIWVSYPRWYMI